MAGSGLAGEGGDDTTFPPTEDLNERLSYREMESGELTKRKRLPEVGPYVIPESMRGTAVAQDGGPSLGALYNPL